MRAAANSEREGKQADKSRPANRVDRSGADERDDVIGRANEASNRKQKKKDDADGKRISRETGKWHPSSTISQIARDKTANQEDKQAKTRDEEREQEPPQNEAAKPYSPLRLSKGGEGKREAIGAAPGTRGQTAGARAEHGDRGKQGANGG